MNDVYFDLSSVLFYHRGVFTRLVPISRIEIQCKIIESNLNSQKLQPLFLKQHPHINLKVVFFFLSQKTVSFILVFWCLWLWEKVSSFYFLRHDKNEMCLTMRLAFLVQTFNLSTIFALLTTLRYVQLSVFL